MVQSCVLQPCKFSTRNTYIWSCAKTTKSDIYNSEQCQISKYEDLSDLVVFCAVLNIRYFEVNCCTCMDYNIVYINIFFQLFFGNLKCGFSIFSKKKRAMCVARATKIQIHYMCQTIFATYYILLKLNILPMFSQCLHVHVLMYL
jgi:hypothetical protein